MGATTESANSRAWIDGFAYAAIVCSGLSLLHWVSLTFWPMWMGKGRWLPALITLATSVIEIYLFLFSAALWFGAYGVTYRPVASDTEESVINFSGISALMVSAVAGVLGAFDGLTMKHQSDTDTTVTGGPLGMLWASVRAQYGHYSSKGKGTSVRDLVFSVFACRVWSVMSCALFAMYFTNTISKDSTRWIVTLVCALGFPVLLGLWSGLWVVLSKLGTRAETRAAQLAITIHAHSAVLQSMICGYLAVLLVQNPNLEELLLDDAEYDRVYKSALGGILGVYAFIVAAHCFMAERVTCPCGGFPVSGKTAPYTGL